MLGTVVEAEFALPSEINAALKKMQGTINSYDWNAVGERKMTILKVFLQLTAAQGYAATTMRSLGAELNLKAPSIYSHFPNGKEEIIAQSLRWQGSLFGNVILKEVASATNVEEYLEALVRGHCRMNLENRENNLWDMIIGADRIGKFLPEDLREEMEEWLRICTDLYTSAGKVLGCTSPEVRGRQIMVLMDGVYSWADWDGSKAHKKVITEQALDLCRKLLLPK